MKFKREYLRDELGLPFEPDLTKVKVISTEIYDTRRWSIDYTLVFQLPDQPADEAWEVVYSVGATECQDESPWEYEEEIEATLVRRGIKTIVVWEPVE